MDGKIAFFHALQRAGKFLAAGGNDILPHSGGNLRQTALQDRKTVVRNGYLLKMLTYFWC
jgi:hypothetical protein